ncbi:MAG: hypothetical protein Q4D19_07690 [Lautropia sp.]|nr:hypothetical protein [Lautropia sp.]
MKTTNLLIALLVTGTFSQGFASEPAEKFNYGIIGTRIYFNVGSSVADYKLLIDYRIQKLNIVELKFVAREENEDGERDLTKTEDYETAMVNCKRKTIAPSQWLEENQDNFSLKRYNNGDAMPWTNRDYLDPIYGPKLPQYLEIICNAL